MMFGRRGCCGTRSPDASSRGRRKKVNFKAPHHRPDELAHFFTGNLLGYGNGSFQLSSSLALALGLFGSLGNNNFKIGVALFGIAENVETVRLYYFDHVTRL